MSRIARTYEPTTITQATQELQEPLQELQNSLDGPEVDDIAIDASLARLRLAVDHAVRTRLIHHRNQGKPLATLAEVSRLSVSNISGLHSAHGARIEHLTNIEDAP